jgi:phospholipid/cholesterol/gamma-HCH transport system ATP-binding protein
MPQPAATESSAVPLIELRDVTCGYGDRIILENVNLVVPRGKVLALMGTSGGGKTTVLRLIGRQLAPMRGQVLIDGVDIATLDQDALYSLRRRMGMLFQFGALFTDLSVFENVAFPLREHTALSEAMIRDLVLMKLNAVGLRGARDLLPSQISGGMSRRVALARAIALDPDLIMYDEPFAGLDPISMGIAATLIKNLNHALGITSIVVSHDVKETFLIADHVVFVANGRIAAQGTPDEMRATADPLVRQFVDGHADGPVRFHYPAVPLAEDFGIGGGR